MNDAPGQVAAASERVAAIRERVDAARNQVAALPRFALLDGPTQLQSAPALAAALDDLADGAGPAWLGLKREDLAPLGLGGNKLRNLEFLVGAARAEGADALVTAGRRWSNHCRLTAAAARMAGLEAHLVLTGPRPATPGPNARLIEALGGQIHWTTGAERREREALLDQLATELRDARRRPFVIGVGGSGLPGAFGQLLAGLELADQLAAAGRSAHLVALASATGGTQAGLLLGLRLAGSTARVLGFTVSRPATELGPVIERLVAEMAGALDMASEDLDLAVELDDRALAPGYGRRSAAADEAAALLARTTGVPADPIYTAKAVGGLVSIAREGALDARSVVLWLGGGDVGLLEELDPS
ncbi:MAG TPA: pyridoxal-phosphate dependent enzyme [Candidatus Limnocylindrales bacterium]|nr:pyridoxal-phosphate dependent enzyme [Candidatus Limnocylindrales bacterium]